jgi:Uma2 family endonuclease
MAVSETLPRRGTAPSAQFASEPRLLLGAVSWEEYEKFLGAVGKRPLRLTYDRGELELMSPLPLHDLCKTLFGLLFLAFSLELGIRIKGCGSPTLRRRKREQGLEPDACYYLDSASRVPDFRNLDLERDPPPDLALEVDITSSSIDRMGVYAGLGVREVWRTDGATLQVYKLRADGEYEPCSASPALPFVPLDEVLPLLNQHANVTDDGELVRLFCAWVRERVAPLWQAGKEQPHKPKRRPRRKKG